MAFDPAELDAQRDEIRRFLKLGEPQLAGDPRTVETVEEDGYRRRQVRYSGVGSDPIDAFVFEPLGNHRDCAVVALHQHASQWDLGKSEIAGLAGDPLQALGPALARQGIWVLAPDAIGFETRQGPAGKPDSFTPPISRERGNMQGWLQYYNHAMHRLAQGRLLMTEVLDDVALAVTVAQQLASTENVGVFGHSYGGNNALFAAGLDTRIAFACASGAACSYRHKFAAGTPLEMALVIPDFATRYDIDDLMRCAAPRSLFIVSSDADPVAADAPELVRTTLPVYQAMGAEENLRHLRVPGPHPLDQQRFGAIVEWLSARAT